MWMSGRRCVNPPRCCPFSSSPSSLGVFCGVSAVSCLGLGPLCPSLFPHPTRAPADDPSRHPLPSAVEGGPVISCVFVRWCWTPEGLPAVFLSLLSCLYWQVSMLGSRFAVLMLFTRVFKQWVLGVVGRSSLTPPSFSHD